MSEYVRKFRNFIINGGFFVGKKVKLNMIHNGKSLEEMTVEHNDIEKIDDYFIIHDKIDEMTFSSRGRKENIENYIHGKKITISEVTYVLYVIKNFDKKKITVEAVCKD